MTTPTHTYQPGQQVRIGGRLYRVINPCVTVDGVEGLVLLGSMAKTRGGALGGGELVALHPDEIAEQQVVPTHRRTSGRASNRAKASSTPTPSTEGQSPPDAGYSPSVTPKPLSLRDWFKPPTEVTAVEVIVVLVAAYFLYWLLLG